MKMEQPLGLVTIAILLSAFIIIAKQRRDWRVIRFFMVAMICSLLAISATQSDLIIATATLIIASELALMPIATHGFDETQNAQFRAVLIYQLGSHLFLMFAVLLNSSLDNQQVVKFFLSMSLLLRLVLPFLSYSLVTVIALLPPSARSLFYLSSVIFGLFIESRFEYQIGFFLLLPLAFSITSAYYSKKVREQSLFVAHAFICICFGVCALLPTPISLFISFFCIIGTSFLSQTNASIPRAFASAKTPPRWFTASSQVDLLALKGLEYALLRISLSCRRLFGPIVLEWISIRLPALLLSATRLLSRFISYSSLPRVIATSITVSVIMLIYILRA